MSKFLSRASRFPVKAAAEITLDNLVRVFNSFDWDKKVAFPGEGVALIWAVELPPAIDKSEVLQMERKLQALGMTTTQLKCQFISNGKVENTVDLHATNEDGSFEVLISSSSGCVRILGE